ncbi:hypothetical protein MMC14_004844 [Varicellaria rhodocarpa]|nr:hypothetical protein [Varicellaria rhodocarpa]
MDVCVIVRVEILECSSKATDGALAADAIGEKAVFNPNPANPTDIVKDLSMAIPHYASKGKDNKKSRQPAKDSHQTGRDANQTAKYSHQNSEDSYQEPKETELIKTPEPVIIRTLSLSKNISVTMQSSMKLLYLSISLVSIFLVNMIRSFVVLFNSVGSFAPQGDASHVKRNGKVPPTPHLASD